MKIGEGGSGEKRRQKEGKVEETQRGREAR